MRVGIYLGRHAGKGGGIAVYARSLLKATLSLLEEHGFQDDEIVFYGDKTILSGDLLKEISLRPVLSRKTESIFSLSADAHSKPLPNGARIRVLVRILPSFGGHQLEILLDQFLLWYWSRFDRLNVLHSLANVGILPPKIPQAVTVHDLYQAYPPETPGVAYGIRQRVIQSLYRAFFKLQFKRIAHCVNDVASVSKEIVSRYAFDAARISEVSLGIDSTFLQYRFAMEDAEWRTRKVYSWKEQRKISTSYMVVFASLDPRKNLVLTLKAWALAKKSIVSMPKLVVISGDRQSQKYFTHTAKKEGLTSDEYVFAGWVPRDEMPILFDGASGVLVPTIAEGFGYPAFEAMSVGTPVISGELPWMKRYAGTELFEIVNPMDERSISQGILALLENQKEILSSTREQVAEILKKKTTPKVRTMAEVARDTFSIYKQIMLRHASY